MQTGTFSPVCVEQGERTRIRAGCWALELGKEKDEEKEWEGGR